MRTHQEIDDHYRALGVDVDAMNKKLDEGLRIMELARRNVRKRRGCIKHFIIILTTEFPIPRLGWIHPEEQAEIYRLEKVREEL